MGEGVEDFKALWVPGIVPFVINKDGEEAILAIGEEGDEPITMTWDVFGQLIRGDFESAEYAKTEAECLGILGNRMLLEVNRFNKQDEVYMNAVSVLTLNKEGLIERIEAFGDPQVDSVTDQAEVVK
jgi:hypothetical protein